MGSSRQTRSGRTDQKCPTGARYRFGTAEQPKFGNSTASKRRRLPRVHKNANITEVYAERNLALATEIAKESGEMGAEQSRVLRFLKY